MFSAATPVLLIQGDGKVRLVEMVGINKSSYPRYSESLDQHQRLAFSMVFVVEINSIYYCTWHLEITSTSKLITLICSIGF